jgi:hypothetical protein
LQPLRAQEPCAASKKRMFKWLRWSREETKPVAEDVDRIVAKSSEQGEPPWYVDPVEELVRIVGQTPDDRRSCNVAGAHRTGVRPAPARLGQGAGDEKGAYADPLWNLAGINRPRPRKVERRLCQLYFTLLDLVELRGFELMVMVARRHSGRGIRQNLSGGRLGHTSRPEGRRQWPVSHDLLCAEQLLVRQANRRRGLPTANSWASIHSTAHEKTNASGSNRSATNAKTARRCRPDRRDVHSETPAARR